jgi:hypothetical protein
MNGMRRLLVRADIANHAPRPRRRRKQKARVDRGLFA